MSKLSLLLPGSRKRRCASRQALHLLANLTQAGGRVADAIILSCAVDPRTFADALNRGAADDACMPSFRR